MRFINKLSIISLVTLLFSTNTKAQTISPFTFNNGGGYSNTLEWSIAESVSIAHFTSFGYSLNTGVLQPLTIITTAIEEYGPLVFGDKIIMGPNPTIKLLRIKASFNEVGAISFQMFDSKSNNILIYDGGTIFSKYEKDIYLENIPAGAYYMKVYFKPSIGNAKAGIYKIIKL
ncbi:MAG: hypothetical protein EBS98_06980 [Chitinophagia bacterium]|nr:hypothetical protein [Chitinophagia bacterium]